MIGPRRLSFPSMQMRGVGARLPWSSAKLSGPISKRTAVFSVGTRPHPGPLLQRHCSDNGGILDRPEPGRRAPFAAADRAPQVAVKCRARVVKRTRTKQTADMLGAERRASGHDLRSDSRRGCRAETPDAPGGDSLEFTLRRVDVAVIGEDFLLRLQSVFAVRPLFDFERVPVLDRMLVLIELEGAADRREVRLAQRGAESIHVVEAAAGRLQGRSDQQR